MTQHTPGPWDLVPDAAGWTLESNGASVTAEPFDCSEADARLIAAAPDLLLALQEMMREFEPTVVFEPADPDSDAITLARAAIDKAAGGTEQAARLCTCGIAPGESVPTGDMHAASCPLFRGSAPRVELSAALERAINMLDDWKAGRPFGLYAQAAVDELRAKLFCHGEWAERQQGKREGEGA